MRRIFIGTPARNGCVSSAPSSDDYGKCRQHLISTAALEVEIPTVGESPSEAILGYCAGFFDGEGHISILRERLRKNPNGQQYGYVRHHLACFAVQVIKKPLDVLAEMFGGKVNLSTARMVGRTECQSRWVWKIASNQAMRFLIAVHPHLIVKGREADIAIAFQRTMGQSRWVSEETFALREKYTESLIQTRKIRDFSFELPDRTATNAMEKHQNRSARILLKGCENAIQ